MKLKQQVIKHYNQVYSQSTSRPESLLNHWSRQRELDRILDLVGPEDTVLDLGCGNGAVSLMMANKAKKVTGVDISRQAIHQAKIKQKKVKISNCSFIKTDINNLKYQNYSADFILCLGIFEYFTNLDKAIKLIIKLLAPEGQLYFHVWNRESLVFKLKKTLGLLDKNKPFKRSFFKLKEIEKILAKNNLVVIDNYGQLIANKFRIANKKIYEALENLGKNRLLTRFLADNLVFIVKKSEASGSV